VDSNLEASDLDVNSPGDSKAIILLCSLADSSSLP